MTDHLTCAELVEQVTDLLDNALSEDAKTRLLEHLGWCEGCDEFVRQFRLTIGVLGTGPPEPAVALGPAVEGMLLAAYRRSR
ncbi:MAG: zf-HC2 domain-containing protein [Nakamurella sp.]